MTGDILLSMGDAGGSVRVPAGGVIELRLPENPTTGYRWTLPPDSCTEMIEDRNAAPVGGAGVVAGVGAASERVFLFRLKGGAPLHLRLDLTRAWEEGAPPESRFEIELVPQ